MGGPYNVCCKLGSNGGVNMKKAVRYTKEEVTLFLRELRSGKYEQMDGTLCGQVINSTNPKDIPDNDTPRFCCLGVLVDVLHVADWVYNDVEYQWETKYSDDTGSMPIDSIKAKLELTFDKDKLNNCFPRILRAFNVTSILAEANDGNYSFREIADGLRKSVRP